MSGFWSCSDLQLCMVLMGLFLGSAGTLAHVMSLSNAANPALVRLLHPSLPAKV